MSDASAESPAEVHLCALDYGPWQEVQARLRLQLERQGLGGLFAPTALILHDILESVVHALHLATFRHILSEEAGLDLSAAGDDIAALFASELHEHNAHNIVRACETKGTWVAVRFSRASDAATGLVALEVPVPWQPGQCKTQTLIRSLGYALEVAPAGTGCHIVLSRSLAPASQLDMPAQLTADEQVDSLAGIARELGYGQIQFSGVGEIVAISGAMLKLLRVSREEASVARLVQAVPVGFFNDIVWGLAMAEGNGAFENYRIRVNPPGAPDLSILFNVSGFRDAHGIVHSLWQTVSLDDSGAQLGEGSILSEARIHNITRNYVPQLVEQKARQAVRLGLTALRNEKRPVAVLFCDIVGYTSYVENHAANESTIDTLNSILRRVAGSVRQHRGFIDKFMGDCAMALFDDPADAVNAAIDMQGHSEDINSLRERAGQQTLQLRIGIHWGEVVIGNVGTAERLDWTAIGDVVNTASRIEKACTPGHILVSRDVRDAIDAARPGEFGFGPLYGLKVKGKVDELEVCWALGAWQTGLSNPPRNGA